MKLNKAELATVLVALRRYQLAGCPVEPGFAICFDAGGPLDADGIDELCERLNAED